MSQIFDLLETFDGFLQVVVSTYEWCLNIASTHKIRKVEKKKYISKEYLYIDGSQLRVLYSVFHFWTTRILELATQ